MSDTSPPPLFSPVRKAANTARAQRIGKENFDFLATEAAGNLADRLLATNRHFELSVDVFSEFDCMSAVL